MAFIKSARDAGEKVFVHCVQGRSRSASVILAFLVLVEEMRLCDAMRLVQNVRPLANPNPNFLWQLLEIE
jgi:protein-tyrosine phosphatase